MTGKPQPTADELVDRVLRILDREVERYEARRKALKPAEVDLLVRVLRASQEIVAIQLDPLGPAGRKKLEKMSNEELQALRVRVEGGTL